MAVRNEIGFMEESLDAILGKQLHLEVNAVGVDDYDAFHLFEVDGTHYLLCLSVSEGRNGFLMKVEDLGGGWYTIKDIEDDAEWERAKAASHWQDHTPVVHR
ncbi:MAG TPA: DUF1292 domain-containing protein [Bacilli bacterium]|nr:DUF1292 domain-containing protein [Bacilli bacterium]